MTGDTAWHDVTPDYFDAVAVAGGVAVRMGTNVAATLHHHADRLVRVLEGEDGDERTLAHLSTSMPTGRRRTGSGFGTRPGCGTARRRGGYATSSRPRPTTCCRRPRCTTGWSPSLWPGTWTRPRARGGGAHEAGCDLAGRWFVHVQDTLVLAANPELARYDLRL
ncbi:hypothetical protein [Saccharomonospora cyanea]|uniref:Uncharacterized protein n=1 Tax=Saccharomonospora cyanea NA-134 TaxID=882082 RepID=H5XQY6_9PSEU|nr:hypothetical protein [Saccharomonospora cyanea]EHR61226.1 hypothetical protein SaccyDRAFT_2350 [Saccharomonospora cyanea NA-134]